MIATLLNLRSLRATARELTLEQLQEGLEKLTQVVNERLAEEEEARAANKEHEEKLQAYHEMLIADGIDPEDLLNIMGKTKQAKQKRMPRPAKYKFTGDDGIEATWTGQGRTPKALKQLLDNGADLTDFEIK